MKEKLEQIYNNRYDIKERRDKNRIWTILCQNYFQQFIKPDDIVLDIAAGYGEFINNINAKKKFAIDLNPAIKDYANKDITVILSDSKKIPLPNKSVSKIFISNFLEHLNNTDEVIVLLHEAHRLLKNEGEVIILQPNIYYTKEKYWYFIDHKTPLTHESLVEALIIAGFNIKLLHKQFLPYTTKSSLPRTNILIKTYLKFPILWKIFGEQTFVIAKKQ